MKTLNNCRHVWTTLASIAIFLTAIVANAQLTVQQVPFGSGSYIDGSQFPTIKVQFKATKNNAPVTIAQKDIVVHQLNRITYATNLQEITPGTYVVSFLSHPYAGNGTIFMTSKGEMGRIGASWYLADPPQYVQILDSMSRRVPYIFNFGQVAAGSTDKIIAKLKANSSRQSGGGEFPVPLKSVSVASDKFEVIWRGWLGNSEPPPFNMVPAFEYLVDIVCKPTTDDYIEDVLTVEYADGFKAYALITANTKPIAPLRLMRLIYPNGGESFAPCDSVKVVWTGTQSGFTSYVEYSNNGGLSWRLIDSTQDTSLTWVVPTAFTSAGKIRVYQRYRVEETNTFVGQESGATAAAFSFDSKYVVIGYNNGMIDEFDIASNAKVGSYKAVLGANSKLSALRYVGKTRDIMATINKSAGGGELLHFTAGTLDPDRRATLPTDITVKSIGTDVLGDYVYMGPRKYGELISYGVENMKISTPIVTSSFITTSKVENGGIMCILADGTIVRYDMNTGSKTTERKTSILRAEGAMPEVISFDASGRQAVIGCQSQGDPALILEQRTYVVDLNDGQVRSVTNLNNSTSPVNIVFTKSGTFLVGAFNSSTNEIVVYDIVEAKRQVSETGVPMVSGKINDMVVSPNFAYRLTISDATANNALIVKTSAPDEDASDTTFSIVAPQFSQTPITFKREYVGVSRDTIVSTGICNTSTATVIVNRIHIDTNSWLRILTDVKDDTLAPGECMTVQFRVTANDTGLITDRVLIETCLAQSSVPVQMYSQDRKLVVQNNDKDFGDICAGRTRRKTIVLFQNQDPIPVTINAARMLEGFAAQFIILNPPKDTIIPPGGMLSLEIVFAPTQLGKITNTLQILYAGQEKVRLNILLTGQGSGADIYASHKQLPFIPEIPVRTVVLYNRSGNDVTLVNARVSNGDPFTIVTGLPAVLRSKDSVVLEVRYDGGNVSDTANLSMEYEPCAYIAEIPLSLYKATMKISAPRVIADVREDAVIPITAVVEEVVPYNGVRYYEGVVDIHERLFFATSVINDQTNGEILSQDVEGQVRHVRFRIEGNFHDTIVIATLQGPAGLADIDSSTIAFNDATTFGTGVSIRYTNGLLKLTNPNPGRYVRVAGQTITAMAPNPASEVLTISIRSTQDAVGQLRVVDANGSVLLKIDNVAVGEGSSTRTIDVASLTPGMYKLIWIGTESTSTASFVVVR